MAIFVYLALIVNMVQKQLKPSQKFEEDMVCAAREAKMNAETTFSDGLLHVVISLVVPVNTFHLSLCFY